MELSDILPQIAYQFNHLGFYTSNSEGAELTVRLRDVLIERGVRLDETQTKTLKNIVESSQLVLDSQNTKWQQIYYQPT